MNDEQLIEFINWLPTAVPELKNAQPEQIVQTLNKMYESEEGQTALSQLWIEFQNSKNNDSQLFKKGGKLDQLTSKKSKNNLNKKLQEGGKTSIDQLSIIPEIKPSGVRGLFWKPNFVSRVDSTGTEMSTNWTGKRATYYKPNGNLIQILTKKYEPGNISTTIRTIKNPFTPVADTTTMVKSYRGETRKSPNKEFNSVFDLNFNKKNNKK